MLEGSCLCGGIQYQIQAELGPVYFCHCSKCRKSNGTAYAASTIVNTAEFKFISGEALLNEFESSEGVFRVFCQRCASPLFSRRANQPEQIRLRIGSIDTPIEKIEAKHIFVASKAPWDTICDDNPQFAERPVL